VFDFFFFFFFFFIRRCSLFTYFKFSNAGLRELQIHLDLLNQLFSNSQVQLFQSVQVDHLHIGIVLFKLVNSLVQLFIQFHEYQIHSMGV